MEFIETRTADGIFIVTFARPAASNAVHAAMRAEVVEALAPVNRREDLRGVVITGAGNRAFCAGNDLAETAAFSADEAVAWVDDLRRFLTAIRDLDKPCIAAVNGVAAGAGFQVALLCDARIGHAGVRLGQPEINVGLASVIGVQLMALTLGHLQTRDLALTGRLVESEEAQRLGLLSRIVPEDEVLEAAIGEAKTLTEQPVNAFRLTKMRLRQMTQAAFDNAFEAAAPLQRAAYESGEPQKIMAHFLERRGSTNSKPR
jgi:enoyl-CoA hydratase/carnithine racemase